MKKFFRYRVLLLVLFFGVVIVGAIAFLFKGAQTAIVLQSTPVAEVYQIADLTTDVWGVFDVHTGEVLLGSNTTSTEPIASITKLFTAEAVLLSDMQHKSFLVEYQDTMAEGRAGKLAPGSMMTPYKLLFPLLIESSNDAALAIERQLGADFQTSVTQVTKELGLNHTVILEPSGLSAENVSTVHELSRYYVHLKKTQPHVLDITQLQMYIDEYTGYINNNPGRTLENFTGGKQGYTHAAKRTFIGSFTLPDSHREIGLVILKSDDLLHDINTLLVESSRLETQSVILMP